MFLLARPLAAVQDAPRDPRVDAIMRSAIRNGEPGASVVVIKDGKIAHVAGYGLANLDTRMPNGPETGFHMASTGKQFTALSLMILHQQGKLDYDAPIGNYLPEVARWGDSLTIRQLLHHTSGIPDYYDDSLAYRRLLVLDSMPDNEDALALYKEWGTPKPAGVEFAYSNSGYDLLGTLVQHLSGQSLDAFLQEHIFGPVGMTGCFSLPNPERFAEPARARGYDKNGKQFVANDSDPLDNLIGSGSVYCSVADLARYDAALYTDQLVRQDVLDEAFVPGRVVGDSSVNYGFAWSTGDRNGHHIESHTGSWEGYLSFILRCREKRLAIFVLANRTDIRPSTLGFRIYDVYLPR